MDPSRPDRILEEWNAVADGARQPSTPPRRVAVRAGSAGLSLAGAGLVAVVLLATAVWLGRPGSTGPGAVLPTASPSAAILEAAGHAGADTDRGPDTDREADDRRLRSRGARGQDHPLGRSRGFPDR